MDFTFHCHHKVGNAQIVNNSHWKSPKGGEQEACDHQVIPDFSAIAVTRNSFQDLKNLN